MALQERLTGWMKGAREKPRAASLAVLLGIAAMLLILLSELWPASDGSAAPPGGETVQTADSYRASLENQLAALIEQINGAGETTVMITLESGEERIYATDTQTGGDQSQQTHVLLEDGTALEETVYLPTVCGVAVVCDGGGDVGVEARITALVSALLDVPSNRICVEQRS
ncbi:stage III sporulation protein AG [Faecalibacterium sp. An192]|uniref:stage III sporulation protein AG n=1 Tax=Faecalibacterium sp. An192 TaxID=1965581 RepID=UPI001FA879ED|nr:stage III sporulation protein AG [Faecalibacterium sp. An192]